MSNFARDFFNLMALMAQPIENVSYDSTRPLIRSVMTGVMEMDYTGLIDYEHHYRITLTEMSLNLLCQIRDFENKLIAFQEEISMIDLPPEGQKAAELLLSQYQPTTYGVPQEPISLTPMVEHIQNQRRKRTDVRPDVQDENMN